MHHLRFEKLVEKTQVFAQISDSHLFAELDGLHHGHNVLANLHKVLTDISANEPKTIVNVLINDLLIAFNIVVLASQYITLQVITMKPPC